MIDLRTPKGTTDYNPKESFIMTDLLEKTTSIYKKHGAVSIDTPTFELRTILTNKYGDDSKLIFDLADQGGDICSLRYDLTVSFARYIAMNRVLKIKRYQVGKVFRRDQPALTKGKFREFTQCDFDIAGSYIKMTADAEVLKIAQECMQAYELGTFRIKVNHRKMLTAFFQIAEIDKSLHSTICSTVDKIDKMKITEIRKEFKTKGLKDNQIKTIENFIAINGSIEEIIKLKETAVYNCEDGKEAIDDLIILNKFINLFKVSVVYDLSLARGTDYYTGLIFEGVYDNFEVGAVIGGGRYDNLVNDFYVQNGGKEFFVPCVGFSVGVARIFSILKNNSKNLKEAEVQVFVGSSGASLLEERLSLLNEIWGFGFSAETFYAEKMNFMKQASFCKKNQIPVIIILGEEEIKKGIVQILNERNEGEKSLVERKNLYEFLKKIL